MKQFLKIHPTYPRQVFRDGNYLYFGHFNRGAWKNIVRITDTYIKTNLMLGVEICLIAKEEDNIKEKAVGVYPIKIIDKGQYGNNPIDFYIKVEIDILGLIITKTIYFGFLNSDLCVEDTGEAQIVKRLDWDFYDTCKKLSTIYFDQASKRERSSLEEKKILKEKEDFDNKARDIKPKILDALKKYPYFFRACQGFLNNETTKTKRNLVKACSECNVIVKDELDFFLDNVRVLLLEIIKEHETISKN